MKRCFYFHLIIILPRLAVVYRCPTLAMSSEKDHDTEHEYVTAFPKMMVQLIVETVVSIVVNSVIGQLLSKLHIDQSGGFWKVKSN